MTESVRLDKWLWAARFFKTRTLATDAIERGRVKINQERCKPARSVKLGDVLDIDNGSIVWQVRVAGISDQRGAAPVAQQLYAETEESQQRRSAEAERHRLFAEPADALRGRPTKRDRRLLDRSRS
jgi:ribosome-associated heat shock protein Hsp15